MKTKKTLIKALIVLLSLSLFALPMLANADSDSSKLVTDLNPSQPTGSQNEFAKKLLGIIQFVGIAVALGMLIIIGIRYVAAPAEEKGKIKDTAIGYLFGAVCIFGATFLLKAIAGLIDSLK